MWHAWFIKLKIKSLEKLENQYEWEKEHLPNLTGTIFASKPKGSLSKLGKRQKSYADYESWNPDNKLR